MQSKTGKAPKNQRRARLAEQLRANLQRRKAQARQRGRPPAPGADTPPAKPETK